MKKTRKSVLGMMIIALVGIVAFSCADEQRNEPLSQSEILLEEGAMMAPVMKVVPGDIEYCGEVQENNLLAGQHHLAGSVIVGNDEDYVYVTYLAAETWMIKAVHLYVGTKEGIPTNKGGNPQVGKFPINEKFSPMITTVTYRFAKDELPDCMYVAAHAEVVRLDGDGNIVQSETGWGEGEGFPGGSWAMFFEFCKRECIPPPPPPTDECYGGNETAWAFGNRYVEQGNWATYTKYEAGKTVEVYAGQHNLAGTVTFSDVVNGKVTITIALDGWASQNVSEALKIQGYDTPPPSSNPAPGQFTTYKGAIVEEVVVDAFAYYGIHFDVRKIVPCPETVE